mgnify:CR=1 FL=1
MLTSFAIIFLTGIFMSYIFTKLHLPSLMGTIFTGIIIGPYCLNLIDNSLLDISSHLRQIALIIILTRAGLSLDFKQLKKSGRQALLMCFIPATFEIIGTIIFAPLIFNISYLEAALIGSVLAAVSPAVVVPKMLKIINEGYGSLNQIPQIIMAGASADDIYVIVLFTAFSSILSGGNISVIDFVQIPISIISGSLIGIICGLSLIALFVKFHIRDTIKVLIILSISFLFLALENISKNYIHISGLIAVMVLGMTLYTKYKNLAKRLSQKYNKLWVGAEIILFVLVGATINPNNITTYGISILLLIFSAMIFRMLGVFISLLKTKLSMKERAFCMFAYTPKATVQAAIGGIPLSMGLDCGNIVLSVAVVAILITAPFGAFMIDTTYKKLLKNK